MKKKVPNEDYGCNLMCGSH